MIFSAIDKEGINMYIYSVSSYYDTVMCKSERVIMCVVNEIIVYGNL